MYTVERIMLITDNPFVSWSILFYTTFSSIQILFWKLNLILVLVILIGRFCVVILVKIIDCNLNCISSTSVAKSI